MDSHPALTSSLSFPRSFRLVTGSQFQAVFKSPQWRVSDRHFLILARVNGLDTPRLGLVVGKRNAKRSVDRAAVKRRAREQFRLRQRELAGLDLIILLRGPCAPGKGRTLTPGLARLLDKLLAKRGQD